MDFLWQNPWNYERKWWLDIVIVVYFSRYFSNLENSRIWSLQKKCSLLFVKSKFGNNNTCIAFMNCHSNQLFILIYFQYYKTYTGQLRYRNMLKDFLLDMIPKPFRRLRSKSAKAFQFVMVPKPAKLFRRVRYQDMPKPFCLLRYRNMSKPFRLLRCQNMPKPYNLLR